jgi:hypothetical protein
MQRQPLAGPQQVFWALQLTPTVLHVAFIFFFSLITKDQLRKISLSKCDTSYGSLLLPL